VGGVSGIREAEPIGSIRAANWVVGTILYYLKKKRTLGKGRGGYKFVCGSFEPQEKRLLKRVGVGTKVWGK